MKNDMLFIILALGTIILTNYVCILHLKDTINRNIDFLNQKLASIKDYTDNAQYRLHAIDLIQSAEVSHRKYTMMLAARNNPSAFLLQECSSGIRKEGDEAIHYPDILEYLLLAQAYSQLDMLQEGRKCFDEGIEIHPDLCEWKNRDDLIRRLYEDNSVK